MTKRLWPIARTDLFRGASALPLVGHEAVWFDTVMSVGRGGSLEAFALKDLDEGDRQRLSTLRPPICGLSMDRPRIMGILNVTPDSFSDGGQLATVEAALERARAMAEVADILDIGGESTRPGAGEVPIDEEIRRTVPIIAAIREAGISTPISIDTRKAGVADAALRAGANIVNDVSALGFDPDMAGVVADWDVPVCLMHAIGSPDTMQNDPRYDDVLLDVLDHLERRIAIATAAGIKRERIILDPGIGFGKTLHHNVSLLRGMALFHDMGLPVLLGASRKRFIGTLGGAEVPSERLPGSLSVALHAASQAIQILRVHDTVETRQAMSLHRAMIGTEQI